MVDTEFVAGKQPDVCPNPSYATAADMDINGERIQAMIRVLVQHHVAITSTLPVLEDFIPTRPGASPQALEAMSAEARKAYQTGRDKAATEDQNQGNKAAAGIKRWELMFRKEMEFERSFVGAGGLLLAGIDPIDGVVAGFGDQREMELLVEAGFTPLEAIKIGSLNGAQFLKEADHIGSLVAGEQADILLVQGDPSSNIHDIENVELVFKDGIGYDSKKLIESVKGQVGTR